ncbi:MAG: hypothetical protein ACD_79C00693G0003 [uncultured bacterium]|nr:MAG: hypothetical protein ACD_79C00693G0003 [uncultured bacterium]
MYKVAVIKCTSYEDKSVKEAVLKGINLLGGINKFVKSKEKILLKPNLLSPDNPEKCVTTHPAVLKACAEIFLNAGAIVTYGDSPAIGSSSNVAKKTGCEKVALELGIQLADFQNSQEVFFKEGFQNKKFFFAKSILENDGIVSLPKLKTHGMQRFTGAVKNQFGCIPGIMKGEFHAKIPNAYHFARLLIDINRFVNPRLYVMDGIQAMEGNGPRGGTPRQMNVLLLSDNPFALDSTACRLINLDPKLVPTNVIGKELGLGSYLEEEIEISGDKIEDLIQKKFKVERLPVQTFKAKGLARIINNILVQKPKITEKKCIKCGLCIKMCPTNPKSLGWKNDNTIPPVYNFDTCIRCFCCQEICPESAIYLKSPILRKLLGIFNFKKLLRK